MLPSPRVAWCIALTAVPALALPAPSRAQESQPPAFRFVPELSIDLSRLNVRRGGGLLSVSPSGRMLFLPELYRSEFRPFDSTGAELGWTLMVGRATDSEIGFVQRVGWIPGDTLWVADQAYDHVVLVDPGGRVFRSLERPSWVRPRWSDRRRYPLFSGFILEAVYPGGELLVRPTRPRHLFDTPLFDRDHLYLLRTDRDGRILRTVMKVPALDGRIELRDGTERRMQRVDYFPRTFWKVSSDGQRVAVVTPALRDSGSFTVTMLDAMGDTVFSRPYRARAVRIPPARRDSILARIQGFGRHSAQAVRDTVRALMPDFESPVVLVAVGIDHSVWVWLRQPGNSMQEWTTLMISPTGQVVGTAVLPRSFRAAEVSMHNVWAITREGSGNALQLRRFRREPLPATAARPARIARSAASSPPAQPRR
jgi:hypothetical protein